MYKNQNKNIFVNYFRKPKLKMLFLFFLSLITSTAFSSNLYSKNLKFTLDLKNATVEEVIKTIESKSEFLFFYQKQHVDINRQVTLNVTEQDVEVILDKLFEGTNNNYRINDRQIVIGIVAKAHLKNDEPIIEETINTEIVQPQQKEVTGKVVDIDNLPLPGVSVMVKGTTIGTVTNMDGEFMLRIPLQTEILQFSFVGMATQEFPVGGQSTFNVMMEEESTGIEEVVAIGYGTQKKQSVVGSIGSAKAEDLKQQGNVSNMADALTGIIPGVSVLSISGLPGGDLETNSKIFTPAEILIRGKTTWNNANPLILVDGVERPMNDIDINEVESVSVLKDASATSVFGVKGGNGVIIITTKRGKEGKARFNVEAEMSYETPSKYVETKDMAESAIARNIAIERTRRFSPGSWNLYYSDEEVNYFRTNQYPYAYQNLRWTDVVLKDFAQSNRVNITASGGTKQVKYFASAAYNHVGDILKSEDLGQGYLPAYSYDRINIRSNFDFEISKSTRLTANFAGMYGEKTSPSPIIMEDLFGLLLYQSGDVPILQYEDGIYGAEEAQFQAFNGYYELNHSGLVTEPRTAINMDYNLTQKLDFITKGMEISGKLAWDNTFRNVGRRVNDSGYTLKTIDKNFYLNGGYYDYDTKTYMLNDEPANMDDWTFYQEPPAGQEGFGWVKTPHTYSSEQVSLGNSERTLYYQLKLDYSRTFEMHRFTGLAMFSRQQYERGSNWPHKREDWVGRITYDYDQRYLIELNGAYNGSEKFGPKYRFDLFPSIAGGWMISNEKFIKNNVKWLDELKLRYSYGLVGNDNVNTGSQWPYLTIWNTYNFNNHEPTYYGWPSPYRGYTRYNEGNPGNPDLHWEKAIKQNLGLELGILNRVSLTADIFNEHRTDMLLSAGERANNIPPLFGKDAPIANIGEAKSRGAEIEIMYRSSIKEFNYWFSTYWAIARSEVVYKESPKLLKEHQKPEGKPIGQTFSGISAGFIESWDDLYAATGGADDPKNGYLMPGDLIMIDFNSDGMYNSNDDNVPYEYPTYPQNNYGINLGGNFKGLELSIRFLGAYNTSRRIHTRLFWQDNMYVAKFLLDETWSPEFNNVNPTYPALALNSAKQYIPTGSFFEYDGSFFRLQSAQFAYSFPKKWTEPLKIRNLKMYVNGRNLFLWTKMPNDGVGMDGSDKNYPTRKQINLGLNIEF